MKPCLTFSFDDALPCVFSDRRLLLASKGVAGTAFLPSGFICDSAPWLALQEAGWEIGSHSIAHSYLPALIESALDREIAGSKVALEAQGFRIESFAYPYAASTPPARKIAIRNYRAARGCGNRVNMPPFDQSNLGAFEGDTLPLATLLAALDVALAGLGWMIVILHGATPEKLEKIGALIDAAQQKGIPILPMREVEGQL